MISTRDVKSDAFRIMNDAINAVKPSSLMRQEIKYDGEFLWVGNIKYDLKIYNEIYVIGGGKASAHMAQHLEEILKTNITKGIVSTKYGHTTQCDIIDIYEAGHPVVDDKGLNATSKILDLLEETTEQDLVICLLSGGGSALLENLPGQITLEEVQKTSELLLSSGANIDEMNIVRKHLSKVKGGKLMKRIHPSNCLTLIISDVAGDKLETIASGTTYYDNSTFADTLQIIEKYGLSRRLPKNIMKYIKKGNKGEYEETIKYGDKIFERVNNVILGKNLTALEKANETAELMNYNTLILNSKMEGESRKTAKEIAGIVKQIKYSGEPVKKPACLLIGGETTVTLRGKGKGGRNQEFALSALYHLQEELDNTILLSCGTDGTDGPTDAAGAFADKSIVDKTKEVELNPAGFLENNNSYEFFERTGGLIKTGPTGTNVMDIVIALIQ